MLRSRFWPNPVPLAGFVNGRYRESVRLFNYRSQPSNAIQKPNKERVPNLVHQGARKRQKWLPTPYVV